MHHVLYPTIAAMAGVASYPVHSTNGSNMWKRDHVRVLQVTCGVTHSSVSLMM